MEDAAATILKLASETMIKAIEDITINEGVHPGSSVLVAGGGAAGLNILFDRSQSKLQGRSYPEDCWRDQRIGWTIFTGRGDRFLRLQLHIDCAV